jgi:hypothetical protein
MATGTITGTGVPTGGTVGPFKSMTCKLDFGSGSVDLEQQMPSGAWIKIDTAITADYSKVFDSPVPQTLRFNCTAFTTAIEWDIAS